MSEAPDRSEKKANGAPDEAGPIPAHLRRERMLAVIKEREYVRIGELSDRFAISDVTVRTDLDALAARGHVHRVRGGAVPRWSPGHEQPFEETESRNAAEKVAIGQAAAALVRDGESVLLDVGTTAAAAARALVARTDLRDVTVFTNGLKTALELEPAFPRVTVVVLGGTLRPLQHSLVNPLATVMLDHVNVSMVLLGCNGVEPEAGVTNINLPEAEIKKRMLEIAGRRIVMADGSKLGRVELARLCAVEDVDCLITGPSADGAVVDALRERGCDVAITV